MHSVRKSRRAEEDLVDIWEYTYDRWGEEQAESYLHALETGFGLLANDPLIGKARAELQDGIRSFPLEHHMAFYRVETDAIYVVRVLHERADFETQLGG